MPRKQYTPPVGEVFGRLRVLREIEPQGRNRRLLCICACGKLHAASDGNLRSGSVRSCGCWQKEGVIQRSTKHRMSYTPEHRCWSAILTRCTNKNVANYPRYGGRGINVCERWLHSFENFYADMGPRPSPKHSIDRKDNDGNYEPDNCRWATRREQTLNREVTNRLTYNGVTKPLSDWAVEYGLRPSTLYKRIYRHGWDVERSLTTPVVPNGWDPRTRRAPGSWRTWAVKQACS